MQIDWKKPDSKEKLYQELDKMVKGTGSDVINISHIISEEFCSMMDVEDDKEFNGWECDWWGKFDYDGITFSVLGGAWYGSIQITLEE